MKFKWKSVLISQILTSHIHFKSEHLIFFFWADNTKKKKQNFVQLLKKQHTKKEPQYHFNPWVQFTFKKIYTYREHGRDLYLDPL